jgi:hypothetical protein
MFDVAIAALIGFPLRCSCRIPLAGSYFPRALCEVSRRARNAARARDGLGFNSCLGRKQNVSTGPLKPRALVVHRPPSTVRVASTSVAIKRPYCSAFRRIRSEECSIRIF